MTSRSSRQASDACSKKTVIEPTKVPWLYHPRPHGVSFCGRIVLSIAETPWALQYWGAELDTGIRWNFDSLGWQRRAHTLLCPTS